MLRDAFRESDIVGRVGGDKSAVLAVSRDVVTDAALMVRFRSALQDDAQMTAPGTERGRPVSSAP